MKNDKKASTSTTVDKIKQIKLAKKQPSKKPFFNTSKAIPYFFSRFGLIIMTIITLCGLIIIVSKLNEITARPYANITGTSTSSGTSNNDNLITVDPATVNDVDSLKTSSNNTNQTLPSGRINPFNE